MQTQHEDLWQITNQSYSVGWKLDISNSSPWGGTIGVGLFMGAASTLKWAGPSVLLAYIIAGLFVFFIMRSMGEMLFLEPVTGSFAVYAHRYMSPVLWLSHRLVLLVYVDGGGDLRNHRHWRLCPVLVPGDGAVDTRIDRGGAGGVGESGGGAVVRRNRVLVRDDQSHHDYRDDCHWPGRDFLWLWQWRAVDWF